MSTYIEEAITFLPARARAALTLACAERALQGVSGPADLWGRAHQSLEEGWRWAGGENVRAVHMYQPIDGLAYDSMDFANNSPERNAILSTVAALACVTRQALNQEVPDPADEQDEAGEQYEPIGADMADVVGDEVLEDCLQRALDAAKDTEAEADRQQKVVARLLADYRTDDPKTLGPPITHAYFEQN